MDVKLPDCLSKIALVDLHTLRLAGISLRLTADSMLFLTLPMTPIMQRVLKVLEHWWHLKVVV